MIYNRNDVSNPAKEVSKLSIFAYFVKDIATTDHKPKYFQHLNIGLVRDIGKL
jgi:hypothetical protein